MPTGCVLLTALCPDPKLAKAALAPFHTSRDGVTTISTSGFVLQLTGQQAVVVTSAATVYPLLQQQRRCQPLTGATHADLVSGSQLHALAEPASAGSSNGISSTTTPCSNTGKKGTASSSSSRGSSRNSQGAVELRLAGVAELPGVREALTRLLEAPSISGPGGWQLGWLLHRTQQAQPSSQHLGKASWGTGPNGGSSGSATGVPMQKAVAPTAAASAVGMLEVACHVAVLLPVCAEGAAELSRLALPWPGLAGSRARGTHSASHLWQGQQVAAVGAPFGALSPHNFSGFFSCGVVSSAVYPMHDRQQVQKQLQQSQREREQQHGSQLCSGSTSGSTSGSCSAAGRGSQLGSGSVSGSCSPPCHPALLLSDLRCAPGMEGAPVFAAATHVACTASAAAPGAGEAEGTPLGGLAGMLLPPLKAPAAQVELALVAPAAAVALAVTAALQLAGHACPPPPALAAGSAGAAAAAAAAAAALAPVAATGCKFSRPLSRPGCSAAAAGAAAAAAASPGQLADALRSVVAVSNGGAWATGVVVSSGGHILTNAHLLETPALPGLQLSSSRRSRRPSGSSSSSSSQGHGSTQAGGQQAKATVAALPTLSVVLPHPPVHVLLPAVVADGSTGGTWATADVLYVFTGPLDLAVLQLRQQPAGRQLPAWRAAELRTQQQPAWRNADHSRQQQPAWRNADHSRQQHPDWRAAELSSQQPLAGQQVCVAGFPAFNPRGGVLGAVVTAGTLAKVVPLPAGGLPAMLLTTAAVHSGASGGAVLDAITGQLCGLVTSNAKHSSRSSAGSSPSGAGASSSVQTVLPHINFCIPASQLRPVIAAAQAAADAVVQACSSGSSSSAAAEAAAATALAAWRALDAAGSASPELQQVWQLDRQRQRPGQLQPDDGRQQQQGAGGMFGGAAPPAKLQQLLHTLQQQQQQPGKQQEEQRAEQQRQRQPQRSKL